MRREKFVKEIQEIQIFTRNTRQNWRAKRLKVMQDHWDQAQRVISRSLDRYVKHEVVSSIVIF